MQKSMVTAGPHSVRVVPEFMDVLAGHTRHFGDCCRAKLEEYYTELAKTHGGSNRPIREQNEITQDADNAIAQAEAILQEIGTLQAELARIYNWHYEGLAEVFRRTRIALEISDIRSVAVVNGVLDQLMDMLKEENATFNRDMFIRYINRKE